MENFDYEKAYKAVLQTATQWIKDGCTDMERICLECVFPELRESEDERINKAIFKALSKKEARDVLLAEGVQVSEALSYLEKQKEQKEYHPLEDYSRGYNAGYYHGITDSEQKPAWNEEDEKDMAHIIRILDDCYAYGKHDLSKTDHENLVNKLKSLRPSWKPSGEQMKALERTIHIANFGLEVDRRKALESLYEQLKQL